MLDFHQDAHGDWVASLFCGHTRHVRHRPPWPERARVLDAEQRLARVGAPSPCERCAER
ncbi:DUF3565 domain-containing protein [Pseudomonas sp. SP16.1]|uniref:DUF3565 domain-containing protein n=1 Tax=Pseudomonas sp. SP16.1 TaxID=3458854 RepID=UPI004045B533